MSEDRIQDTEGGSSRCRLLACMSKIDRIFKIVNCHQSFVNPF
ncbi:hypothetical protein D1AOALGA4SA_13007 [Olavius algarvensis Delta 1 endosymbiont]|nr:hypothetical protein D1AOALGA4SA_13007 [Olavius algarvensis Delta 1 endosymbiont]